MILLREELGTEFPLEILRNLKIGKSKNKLSEWRRKKKKANGTGGDEKCRTEG